MTYEPGPELDRLVGEAVGWTDHTRWIIGLTENDDPPLMGHFTTKEEATRAIEAERASLYDPLSTQWEVFRVTVFPKFSTDWNAAMQAAEKCGLFEEADLQKCETEWCVVGVRDTCHESGPTAICLAILKLKGVK